MIAQIEYHIVLICSYLVFSSHALRLAQANNDPVNNDHVDLFEYDDPAVKKLTVGCADGTTRAFSSDMVMIKDKGLWCPTAKAGTSSMYKKMAEALKEPDLPHKRCYPPPYHCFSNGLKNAEAAVRKGMGASMCDRFSFVVVRNPWQRLISAYQNKVLTHTFPVPGRAKKDNVTFPEFIRAITKRRPDTLNIHWRPVSVRCLTQQVHYDVVHRLEDGDLDEKLDEFLMKSGLDLQTIPKTQKIYARTSDEEIQKYMQERIHMYTEDRSLSHPRELVDLVGKFYAIDVEQGRYSFENYA